MQSDPSNRRQEEIPELGENYREFKKQLKFGTVVRNGWASEDNPQRDGIFIGFVLRQGRQCPQFTNESATERWEIHFDKQSKFKILSSLPPSGEEETAVGFAEWLSEEGYEFIGNHWRNGMDYGEPRKTSSEMYSIFQSLPPQKASRK